MIMKSYKLFFIIFAISYITASCSNDAEVKPIEIDQAKVEKIIEETNRVNIKIEDEQIDDYLRRRAWKFNHTKSGLRYKIYKQGSGLQPNAGEMVFLDYTINLIRGDLMYSSQTDGPMIFKIDKDDVVSGLNEFVKMMRVGDKAKLIVPSYLGFGATGDDKKIPARATLIYDLTLRKIAK